MADDRSNDSRNRNSSSSSSNRGYRRSQSGSRGSSRRYSRYQRRRRKYPPVKIDEIEWKNLKALRYFLDDNGSIRPRRKTGASAKYQRRVALAVKRARHMALLPFTGGHNVEMGQELARDLPDFRRSTRQPASEAEEA